MGSQNESSSFETSSPATTRGLPFTLKQQEAKGLLRGPQRHTLLVGGSRSGKTTLLVHEIAARALKAGNSRHAILRLHANVARTSIALDTLPKVFRLWFPTEPLKRHRVEGYFSLKNGSEIWIGGLGDQDQVEKILGKEYATIFLNECSQIPYASVLVTLTRLAQVVKDLPQTAFYDLNPTNKVHWTNILFGTSAIRCRASRWSGRGTMRGCFLIRATMPPISRLSICKALRLCRNGSGAAFTTASTSTMSMVRCSALR